MSATVRPRLNIGIAMAGAGAIALAPIMQPLPSMAEPLAHSVSTVAVSLSATTNPIEQWLQIINTAAANGGALAQTYLDNPAPILRQLILNGIGYGGQTFTALQDTITNLVDNLRFDNPNGLPANLQNAWNLLVAGDIAGGLPALYSAVAGYALLSAFPLINLAAIPTTMAQNFAKVVESGIQGAVGLVFGALTIPAAIVEATANQLQSVLNAVQGGDVLGAFNAVLGIPGAFVGALLNGSGFNAGLLSPDGLFDQAIRALNSIAQALGAVPPAAAMSTPLAAAAIDSGPSALPANAEVMATITVETAAEGAGDGASAVTTEIAPAATAAPEPVAAKPITESIVTEPVAAEPVLTEPEATEPAATEPAVTEPAETDTEPAPKQESPKRDLRTPSARTPGADAGKASGSRSTSRDRSDSTGSRKGSSDKGSGASGSNPSGAAA